MKITFKGNPVTIGDNDVRVGDMAPNFNLTDNNLKNVSLSDTKGKRIFVVVPSLDTPQFTYHIYFHFLIIILLLNTNFKMILFIFSKIKLYIKKV